MKKTFLAWLFQKKPPKKRPRKTKAPENKVKGPAPENKMNG